MGIPVAVDRLVQQAILQVLNPILDPTFSNSSYGFRPGRDAHMALEQARKYVAREGRETVVDLDLEPAFDRVNHDILMSRVARRIGDKRLLRVIRRFLQAGLMQDRLCVTPTREPHQTVRSPLCYQTFRWTTWTGSWNAADIASAATPTTATSMCGRWRQGNE